MDDGVTVSGSEVYTLRARYPLGLICTGPRCDHRLIAVSPRQYAASGLTEEQRLAFVCAGCRWEEAERQRVAAIRTEVARSNILKAHQARRSVDKNPGDVQGGGSVDSPSGNPAELCGPEGGFLSTRSRGGRPRKHSTPRAAKTAAQKAWRERRRRS